MLELGAGIWAGEVRPDLWADLAPHCRMMGTRNCM